jgi:hypothetical protein
MDLSASDDVADLTVSSGGDRRRYNRRRPDSQPVPPYFSVFERMADALEAIVGLLGVAINENQVRAENATPGGPSASVPRQPFPEH